MKKYYLLFLLFLNSFVFSQNKTVRSFSLEVERTTHITGAPDSTSKSKMTYLALPYEFMLESLAPQRQYVSCKAGQCLVYDDETKQMVEFSEGLAMMAQTVHDMNNWFKADCGLTQSGYRVTASYNEKKTCYSVWSYCGKTEQIIKTVHTFYDSTGRFTKLQMFLDDDTLFTQTTLSEYAQNNGFVFPTSINTESYDKGNLIMRTELKLSNVSLNKTLPVVPQSNDVITTPMSKRNPPAATSSIQHSVAQSEPAQYDSLISLCSYGAYSFYKRYITEQDMSNCGFTPSCSQYMLEAVRRNGILGIVQGYERYKRCTSVEHKRDIYPVTAEGKQYDPVP